MAGFTWVAVGLLICWLDLWAGRKLAKTLGDGRPEAEVPQDQPLEDSPTTARRRKLHFIVGRYVAMGASGFIGGWVLTRFGVGDLETLGCSNLFNMLAAAVSAISLRFLLKLLVWLLKAIRDNIRPTQIKTH